MHDQLNQIRGRLIFEEDGQPAVIEVEADPAASAYDTNRMEVTFRANPELKRRVGPGNSIVNDPSVMQIQVGERFFHGLGAVQRCYQDRCDFASTHPNETDHALTDQELFALLRNQYGIPSINEGP